MDVFDLYAKIKLDTKEYESNLKDASGKFEKFGEGLKGAIGKLGDILAGIGKTAAVGIGAAGTALTALTKQTLDAVGEFEQLEGGAQKIFDEMDFERISRDAKNAYKELNMSASEYLESINLAGATFAMTMGDEKGYDTARKGMIAIADFASGTGKNLTELNQKFQLITRSATSYQSIADQFAGILPQTSADFLEAAQAAGLLSNEYKELKDIPVAEYQQAVTEMIVEGVDKLGLAQNTLRESTETLTGSFAMARAAWQNFLTGQSDTKTFTGALSSAISQTMSKLDTIIPRLTTGLTEIADQLAPEIPPIIEQTLPAIITGASSLLTGLAERLPDLLTTILPSLAEGVVDVSTALVGVMPELITSLKQSIPIIVRTIMSKKDELLQAGKDIISALFPSGTDGIAEISSKATALITDFAVQITNPSNISRIFDTGLDILDAILSGLTSAESLDKLLDVETGVPKIIDNIGQSLVSVVDRLLDSAVELIDSLCSYFLDPKNEGRIEDAAGDILIHLGKSFVALSHTIYDHIVKLMSDIMYDMVGTFDADDTSIDILMKLGKALVRNAAKVLPTGLVWKYGGKLIDSTADIISGENYLSDPNATGSYPDYIESQKKRDLSKGYSISQNDFVYGAMNANAESAYRHARGYATGGVFNRPTYALIGEDGAEAVMPLEKNTGWIQTLADKINGSNSGTIINVTINAPSSDASAIARATVSAMDEAFSDLQIAQDRSIGGVTW